MSLRRLSRYKSKGGESTRRGELEGLCRIAFNELIENEKGASYEQRESLNPFF